MKQGDKVLIEAEVDAFKTGLNSGVEIRVKVGDTTVWVPESAVQDKKGEDE